MTASRRILWIVPLVLLYGCQSFPDTTDQVVSGLARELRDPDPLKPPDATPAVRPGEIAPKMAQPQADERSPAPSEEANYLQQLAAAMQQPKDGPVLPPSAKKPLTIPPGLPGIKAPPIVWPKTREEQERLVEKLYPPMPPLPPETIPVPGPEGRPLTLSELQSLASANNPSIKNAVAGVEAAKGAMKQAGAYPNPTVAWETDTAGTSGGGRGSGYPGAYVDQVIKTGSDLKLKTAAAQMDLQNAELALIKARSDLATQVRSNYFVVLVALENIKISRALAQFTDKVYSVQVDLVRAGTAAPYEPMQLRPLALQARFNLYQAQNQYRASWKQLAAALGLPFMPPTAVAGRVDLPVPVFDHHTVEQTILNRHTDVLTALNNVKKARYLYELARVTPFPDFDARVLIQKDYTAPPFLMAYSGVLSMTLPVWDLNKGNIYQTQNQLTQAYQSTQSTKLQLIGTLAEAFNRYATAQLQVRITLQQVEDYLRAYRGVYDRYHTVFPREIEFNDVVTAQQALVTAIMSYVTALGAQWTAVVDVANLLQTTDLFQTGRTQEMTPVPDLEQVLPWPFASPAPPCGPARTCTPGTGAPVTLLPPSPSAEMPRKGPEVPATSDVGAPARLGPVLSSAEETPIIQSAPAAPAERLESPSR
jgi:cobalt-zinc-cadmium efflux system outer membrane protein